MKRSLIAGLTSLCCAATAPAWSADPAAYARADVGPFKWSFYDANPNDGIDASISFLDATNALRSLAQVYIYHTNNGSEILFDSAAAFSPSNNLRPSAATKTVTDSQGHSGAGIIATPNGNGALLSVGQVHDLGVGFDAYAGISSSGSEFMSPTFYNLTLGPGTGLNMSTSVHKKVLLEIGRGKFANAGGEILAVFSPPDSSGGFDEANSTERFEESSIELNLDMPLSHPLFFVTESVKGWARDDDLALSYENLSDQAVVGRIRVSAWAYGEALPIPEPGSAALLLLGTAMLGWRMRRVDKSYKYVERPEYLKSTMVLGRR